ncbi:MAG: PDZ domain-containing protein, partial [Anaerolineae bacterium]|nr:PDZ domain-containing protein [Phycisphaerae bacterium]
MRISRAKWLWAAVMSSALFVAGPMPELLAQDAKLDQKEHLQQAQVATVEQLKHEAFKALRGGNFDRSDELIRAAASMSADDRSLAQMSEWIAQYKHQRSDFVAERKQQYDKVVADVHKLIDGGKETFAIDKATEAYTLSDNKENFSKEPWVASLMTRAAQLAQGYEANDDWLKSRRIWSEMGIMEPANPQWKEKFNAAHRRARLLALYAPDDFTKLSEVDLKDRLEADALLKGPSTQPATTQPTTKPLAADNDEFKTDWRDTLKGVRRDMLDEALSEAKSNYWKDVNYRTMLTGGLKGVKALITTKGLEKTFPSLADDAKRNMFAAKVEQNMQMVANLQRPEDEQPAVRRVISDLRITNRQTLQLPDEVLVNEFADGAFADLDQFTNMIWPSEVEEFYKTTKGEFGGVGIQINSDEEGNLKVVSPVEDTPAYKLGVKAGDIITRINGKNAKGITTTQAVKNITGTPGTEVT